MIRTSIPGFILKQAQPEDSSLIIHFIKELAKYEKLIDTVVITEDNIKEYLFGDKIFAEVLLAYFEEQAVGFALYFHNFSTFAGRPGLYLEDVYIMPEMRGRGFGKEIMLHLVSLAKERNCGRMEWAVLDWNSPAINFYKSLGAVPMDEWTVFRLSSDKF
ncbi:MAG: GNAT family N-acetyltransferase [Bacteroidetes bacterium]|nr:GNAT family N-acetyltransferase [Bacteroidota bacterium]